MGKVNDEDTSIPMDLATTDEGRAAQLAAAAYDEVEYRIRNHKASSMELVYFLKLGSEKAKLEQEQLEASTRLSEAKIKALESGEQDRVFYQKVLDEMRACRIDDGGDYE